MKARILMFSVFATHASFLPFFSLYAQDRGVSSFALGNLWTLLRACMALSTPLASSLSDRYRIHCRLTGTLMILAAMLSALFDHTSGMAAFAALVALYSLCSGPKSAICDSLVLWSCPSKEDYAQVRLWGSISWGVVALSVGAYVTLGSNQEAGSTDAARFTSLPMLHSVALVILAAILFFVIADSPRTRSQVDDATEGGSPLDSYTQSGKDSLDEQSAHSAPGAKPNKSPTFLSALRIGRLVIPLFAIMWVSWAENAVVYYLFPYVRRSLHGPPILFSWAMVSAIVSEVTCFAFANRFLRYCGCKNTLIVSAVAYTLKMLAYGLMVNPWMLVIIEGMHGLCFALLWTAAVQHVDTTIEGLCAGLNCEVPKSLAMTLLWVSYSGLPPIIAGSASGYVVEQYGEVTLFCFGSVLCAAAAMTFYVCGQVGYFISSTAPASAPP